MSPEPALVVPTAATTCAIMFLFALLSGLWKPVHSIAPGNQRLPKTILALTLAVILSWYWLQGWAVNALHPIIVSLSLIVSILASLAMGLAFLLGKQSRQLSDLSTVYLLVAILCDVVYLLMPSNTPAQATIQYPFLIRCCIHLMILGLEFFVGSPALTYLNRDESPEDRHGILSRTLFFWIFPIIIEGYRNNLLHRDLPPLSHSTKPSRMREAMLEAWSRRIIPETTRALPLALLRCLEGPFYASIGPRLFLIVFRYSQPVLIKQTIRYVIGDGGSEGHPGFWLLISAISIYVGLAVSTAFYHHKINKLKLMTRSALVGLVHDKIMKSPSIAHDNGEATTLISTDVENVDGIGEMIHETWAQILETTIGVITLATQVGWIWIIPLFLIYMCSHMSRFVVKHLQPRQTAWTAATQNRIAATTSVFNTIKVVKMLGLQHSLSRRIKELRNVELWAASRLRWVMVYYNSSANALGIFTPAITLVTYATLASARGQNLDTETAFATMAILSLVTHPANMVMTIVPRAVAVFSSFERVQAFLLRPDLRIIRKDFASMSPVISSDRTQPTVMSNNLPAVRVSKFTMGRQQNSRTTIDFEVKVTSFTIISGSTGCGKSTLLRSILGEVTPDHGSIRLQTKRIGYCAQRPWLPHGTIEEVIQGPTQQGMFAHSGSWYREVTSACCLTHDFESLPEGDQTQIGSRGLNLSGGQRQRVALARALLARCDLLLLDDTFSGLDGDTEQTIFDNLFGPTGLLRRLRTTVILVSNSSQYFQTADKIVVLGDNMIVEQGAWHEIQTKIESIAKFSSGHRANADTVLGPNFAKLGNQVRVKDETRTDLERRTGDPSLYAYYLNFIGLVDILLLVSTTASYAFFITAPQLWLQLWTQNREGSVSFYVSGFLFLSAMSWLSTSAQMWAVLIRLAPRSGSRLHRRLLDIMARAPLSYFSSTDIGSILNRFSQDIQLVDKQLPSGLQTMLTQIFKLLMQIITLCIAEKWLALSLPISTLIVYLVQKVYLRTSRQLRFLELEARAEVVLSFLESIEGLETMRSFGWAEAAIEDNILSVDHSQRPEFLLMCLQRWLNFVLDLLAAAIATSAIAIAVVSHGRISGAQVGIALNIMLVANSTLLKLVESWTTLETSLGAISRFKTLEETTPVEGGTSRSIDPPKDWPSAGTIDFKNIAASYQSRVESAALRNFDLRITGGQKLIVCGRTGSGKSTLLLTLVRLLELQSGRIEVDGVDIKNVALDILRQRAFIFVPQDPLIFFSESLRFNLDPDGVEKDDTLIAALVNTGLWAHFTSHDEIDLEPEDAYHTPVNVWASVGRHPVLDQKLSLLRELSGGQSQLFAICRALVKANTSRCSAAKPVILLDEVTSSLDISTESSIYRIVDDEFTSKGHTVIMVAHRIGTLLEYTRGSMDAIAVMVDGRLQQVTRDMSLKAIKGLGQVE
ncbi:putative ABC transporter [Xylariaceae sp. FL0255]|nr:putative ABC transporter [Xylariaceae sp. FL0255]